MEFGPSSDMTQMTSLAASAELLLRCVLGMGLASLALLAGLCLGEWRLAPTLRRQRAFTLIELLVVIAVIAILAAILFPVFARAREKARQASCISNLRQMAAAFQMYGQDYDERWVPDFIPTSIKKLSDVQKGWYMQIQPYLQSVGVLHCPSDPITDAYRITACSAPKLRGEPSLPSVSYGANSNLVYMWQWKEAPFQTVASVPRPALTLLVSDCAEPWAFHFCPDEHKGERWSHIGYASGPPDDCRRGHHGGHSGAGHERHTAGSNIAYVDGHVQYLPADRIGCHIEKRGEKWYGWESPLLWPDALAPGEQPPAP